MFFLPEQFFGTSLWSLPPKPMESGEMEDDLAQVAMGMGEVWWVIGEDACDIMR